jgi:hypothetical protein
LQIHRKSAVPIFQNRKNIRACLHPQSAVLSQRLLARGFQTLRHFFRQKCCHFNVSLTNSLRGKTMPVKVVSKM